MPILKEPGQVIKNCRKCVHKEQERQSEKQTTERLNEKYTHPVHTAKEQTIQ